MRVHMGTLPKKVVLLALYNNALGKGDHDISDFPSVSNGIGRLDKAKELIVSKKDNLVFGKVDLGAGLRYLSVDLTNTVFDTEFYDLFHGSGLGAQVVEALLVEQKIAPLLKRLREHFRVDDLSTLAVYSTSAACTKDIGNILKLVEFDEGPCSTHCSRSKQHIPFRAKL